MSRFAISVAQLNGYVSSRLEQDPFLSGIWVEGEIERPKFKGSGCYFSLIDESATVDCVAWGVDANGLRPLLVHGKRVYASGRVALYAKGGKYQISVARLEEAGLGELYQKTLEIMKRMEAQGFFAPERKRPIPKYPRRVAVVTSPDGAALQDVLNVMKRRNPLMKVMVYPALVQGVRAPASLVSAIEEANAGSGADILIVARGGGSAGDLAAFNTEEVALAVAGSVIPVISAVGHETDTSLCDMVADQRAPTPSAAAELASPDLTQILADLARCRRDLTVRARSVLQAKQSALEAEKRALRSLAVTQRLGLARQQLQAFTNAGRAHLKALLEKKRSEIGGQKARLEALNPSRILRSGYAVVLRDGQRVNEAAELRAGDTVTLMFADGTRTAKIAEEKTDG